MAAYLIAHRRDITDADQLKTYDELGLVPGKEVVCVVKSTDVMVEVPS